MKKMMAVLTALAFLGIATAAWGAMMPASVEKTLEYKDFANQKTVIFFDDFDPPQPGWSTSDMSYIPPKFHEDAYNADPIANDPCADGMSWWCGEINPGFLGGGEGYGDNWTQWLLYENVDVTGYAQGSDCLLFAYDARWDSEVGWDFSYAQAYNPTTMAWDNLNPGYDGSSGGWQQISPGFILEGVPCGGTANYIQADNTVDVRFLVATDSNTSDADGLYDSDGGAFSCDDVRIFSFFGGVTYLNDCDQSIGVPGPPPAAAGDYWYLGQRPCLTFTPPNSYVCEDQSDTTSLPGGLDDWLISPIIDLTGFDYCTMWYTASMHFDYDATWGFAGASYARKVSLNGGLNWNPAGAYIGDNERHYGGLACDPTYYPPTYHGILMDALMAANPSDRDFRFAVAVNTDPGGAIGCEASNTCRWVLHRLFLTAGVAVPVEPTGWGDIKSMLK
jgi:hypothetical protein